MPQGLTIREFARQDGCDEALVRRKLKSGHLKALKDGSIAPQLVGSDWRKRVRTPGADTPPKGADSADPSAAGVRSTEDAESIGELAERILQDALGEGRPLLTKAEAETLKENYAARLRQLEYDREIGRVADVEEFATAVAAEYALVKNRLFNIGSKIAPRAAVMKSAEEIKALIDREVTLALQELTLDTGGRGAGAPAEPL